MDTNATVSLPFCSSVVICLSNYSSIRCFCPSRALLHLLVSFPCCCRSIPDDCEDHKRSEQPIFLVFCLLPLAGLPFPPISLPRGGDPRTQYRPISIPLISILSFPTGKASNIKTQGALALMLLNLSEWHLTEETKGS